MKGVIKLLKRKSPANRIFVIVLLAFLVQTSYFVFQYYQSTVTEAQNVTCEKLKGIANTIALQINAEEHEQLMSTYKSKDAIASNSRNPIYDKIHNILKTTLIADQLSSPIYTLVLDSTGTKFEFGVTSSEEPYFRHSYTHFPNVLIEKKDIGGTLSLYKDEFGSWNSAFTPLKNKKGEVVALVMVDEKFDKVLAYINKVNRKNIYFSFCIFLILGGFMFYFIKKTVQKEEDTLRELRKAFNEKREFSEKLYQSEEKLKEYALQLEKSNKELTDFAHIASHDLKAPIRGIQMFVQLFEKRNKERLDERDMEYINFIKINTNQSLKLIEGLLNYSKIDKCLGDTEDIQVTKSVDTAVINLKSIIDEKNALVIYKDLPTINAHSLLISQLFQNLINNGIKYNESKCPQVIISAKKSDEKEYVFSITDNGIGIPEHLQSSVFEMFQRLHSSSVYEGSGIGLAFCTRIVETYKGRMWLQSEVGKGSTFYFTLPTTWIEESTECIESINPLKVVNKAA